MPLRSRRVLFAFFSFLFLIASSVIILYVLGWRINWEDFQLQKTGAVAIKTNPRGVIIKLDNKKYADESSIIQNHTLISNLTPKTYLLTIEKDGFRPYQKKLKIKPSMVEAVDIFLVPERLNEDVLIASLKGNSISDISADSQKIIVKNDTTNAYYLYDLQNPKTVLNIKALVENLKNYSEIKKMAFVPFDSNRIIIESKNGIEILDLKSRSRIEKIINGKISAWDLSGSIIYFANAQSKENNSVSLFSYNLIFKTQSKILDIASSTIQSAIIDLKVSGTERVAFSDSAQKLYLYSGGLIKKIADSIKLFEFSPNGKALAFIDKNQILNIYYIDEWGQSFHKKPGDLAELYLSENQPINKIAWFKNSLQVFLIKEEGVDLIDIDDRPPINKYPIKNTGNSFFYNSEANLLYFITQNRLFKINFEI